MKNAKILFSILGMIFSVSVFAQKQISITIDDPNSSQTPLLSWQERNIKLLDALDRHNIKSALFVCGMRVDDDNGRELLKKWDAKNHLICNHSYSHFYYHSSSITSDAYIHDFLKADSLLNSYNNYTKLFRFPFLKEGNTASKRDVMREALAYSGYKNGYVTIDASDWYIDSQITEVLKQNPAADLEGYKMYYINHILNRAEYYDSLAMLIYKRNIHHTLLIHHSLLNALFLDDLLKSIKERGWKLIDAKEAFNDEIFNLQPVIEPCGESLVWQCAKLDSNLSGILRYPAEDSRYEKEPLEKFIQDYNSSKEQETEKLSIHHLTDNFYVYTTYKDINGFMFPSNSMYLITEYGAVLFDTPWDTTQFQPLLDSILVKHNKKVIMAISTHYHDDRTAGLEFLRRNGVKTYSSKLTYDLCKEHNEKQAEFFFEKDTMFNVGNYKFETYYAGEGHTKDNIVIWFDKYKILYGGCLVKSTENKNLGNIADANLKEWKPTIKKLIKKYPKPNFVIPGHFSWTSNKGLPHTLKLLRLEE